MKDYFHLPDQKKTKNQNNMSNIYNMPNQSIIHNLKFELRKGYISKYFFIIT